MLDKMIDRTITFVVHVWDSYDHYRIRVGLNPVHAAYRAVYRKVRGKEPGA